ncbi:MAG TPA: DUF1648 domain-containing protein [Armatimonadota bacterium]
MPEYLGVLMLGALVAITYQGAVSLPERIPTHFGVSGAVDGWGPKLMLYVLVGILAVVYLGLTLLQRVPGIYNYPVKVTDENRTRLQMIAVGMMRWMKVEIAALVTYIQWVVVQVGTHQAAGMSTPAMLGLVGLLLGTCAFFTVWLIRSK